MLKQLTITLKIKRTKMHKKYAKHYNIHENYENTTSKKTRKTMIKPGSSHPYTQRQLVLERKLKTTCPQVRIFTPEITKLGYNRGMQIVTGSEKSEIQLSSIYPSNREDSEFTKRII